jgi:hypothetical protein
MQTISAALLLSLAIGVSGCNPFGSKPNTQLEAGDAARRYEWRASLFTPAELAGAMQIRGNATWSRDGDASRVTLGISNATPGGSHPWHVHRGRCGDNGPIVGDASAYKPLQVDDKGNASASARLDLALPASGDYYVNVHALATNLATIISCGNLAPPIS